MKKIIISICIFLITSVAIAQTQAEIDKAMKDLQDVMKNLPPEAKEQMDKIMGQQSTNINELKKSAPKEGAEIGTKTSKIIGPEGGELKSENGKITLKFPAGAVSKKIEISIEEIENTADNGSGNAFQLLPEGLQFGQPVKLILKYTNEEIAGSEPDDLNIMTENIDGGMMFNITSITDTNNHIVTADIRHFSKWGLSSRFKINLLPKSETIHTGQSVSLVVKTDLMRPVDIQKKKEKYEEYLKKQKELKSQTLSQARKEQIQKEMAELKQKIIDSEDKYSQLSMKMKLLHQVKYSSKESIASLKAEIVQLKSELGVDADNMLPVLSEESEIESTKFNVSSWTLNSKAAPVSNASGSLSPQGFIAKYTAPKTLTSTNRMATVSVNLISKSSATSTVKKYKLTSTIQIIDEGYLNYTVDDTETKTLQFAYSSAYQKLAKEEGDKVAERTTAQCFYYKEEKELSIGTVVMMPFLDKQILISFGVKNPRKGLHLINCNGDGGISVTLGAKSLGIVNDPCTNTEKYRYNDGKGCSTRDICKTFELNLTEFDGTDGGTVAGNFSGTVYEDGDAFKVGCNSSKPHFVTGDFSLIIKTEEEGKKYESLTTPKPVKKNEDSEKVNQVYDRNPAGLENITDDDLVPLVKPTPKSKPAPKSTSKPSTKPKPKTQEIKPFE